MSIKFHFYVLYFTALWLATFVEKSTCPNGRESDTRSPVVVVHRPVRHLPGGLIELPTPIFHQPSGFELLRTVVVGGSRSPLRLSPVRGAGGFPPASSPIPGPSRSPPPSSPISVPSRSPPPSSPISVPSRSPPPSSPIPGPSRSPPPSSPISSVSRSPPPSSPIPGPSRSPPPSSPIPGPSRPGSPLGPGGFRVGQPSSHIPLDSVVIAQPPGSPTSSPEGALPPLSSWVHPVLLALRPRPGEPGSSQNPGTIQPGPSQKWLATAFYGGLIPIERLKGKNDRCTRRTICMEGTCCLANGRARKRCKALSKRGQPCSPWTTTNVYLNHCPCGPDEGTCVRSICT
ncbi:uncharacterized protein LOC119168047 isoform X5 [Rhipicephalus microplus]|uniref:uncharacterized protein LOC119168047 isoform X5 n=1 Tax=Rhipicephalus microplus TaxID=6941 RepID=UPI003F6A62B0